MMKIPFKKVVLGTVLSLLFPLVCVGRIHSFNGRVVNVIDGDSIIVLNIQHQPISVRLYGIDAPERDQPFGKESGRYLRELLKEKVVEIQLADRDKYGRLVGRVYVDGPKEVSELMVKKGYAWVYNFFCKLPQCQYWKILEKQSQEAKRGLWGDPDAKEPWLCRRNKNRRYLRDRENCFVQN